MNAVSPVSKITGVEAVAGHRMNKGSSNADDPQRMGGMAELKKTAFILDNDAGFIIRTRIIV